MTYKYSALDVDVIYPENFEDFEQFMTTVQATWDNEWKEVFSTSWEGKSYYLVRRAVLEKWF